MYMMTVIHSNNWVVSLHRLWKNGVSFLLYYSTNAELLKMQSKQSMI